MALYPGVICNALLLAQAAQAGSATDLSVWDLVVKGGWVMIPIGLASLVAVTLIVERLISLRRKRVIPPEFLRGLSRVLAEHPGQVQAALDHCQRHPSPMARVFAAGIRHLHAAREVLDQHISEAGDREVFKMRRFLRGLAVIGSIAPLLGLLGTVFGMITAFQTVAASGEALGKTELLAAGIYEALITTAAGLLLAIPVLICHHAFSAHIESLAAEMDHLAAEFIEQHADGRVRAEPARITPHDGAGALAPRAAAL